MDQEEYDKEFEGNGQAVPDSVRVRALDRALDIRKFEIELYWKRATYFWAFLAVTLAGYFTLRAATINEDAKKDGLLIVSCLGVVFSVTWYFVNRASKFWQENWEHHVNLLESKVIGPLYETVIGAEDIRFRKLSGPYPFSVSKLNQILSLSVVGLFVMLVVTTLLSYYCCAWPPDVLALVTVILTAFTVWCLYWKGRTRWWELPTERRVNHVLAHRLTTNLPEPPATPPDSGKSK